jgi:transposase
MARPTKEFQAFRNLTDRLLTVSKETVDKRIAAYKAEREKLPRSMRQGQNPKGYRKPSDAHDPEQS